MITHTIETPKNIHAANKTANQCLPGANADMNVIENSNAPPASETSIFSRPYPVSRFR